MEGRVAGTVDEAIFHEEIERILADIKKSAGGVRQLWIADLQGTVIATTQRVYLDKASLSTLFSSKGWMAPLWAILTSAEAGTWGWSPLRSGPRTAPSRAY